MRTLALALHVVRRDLVHRRWLVAGWLVVVALATFDAAVATPVSEAAGARLVLLPLGALLLAAGIVKVHPPEGALPGTPAYWRTLPIPLRALLLGRVAAAAVLLCIVPLVGQAVALVALDTPAAHLPGHLATSAVPLAGVVLGGLLVGSLTRGIGGAAVFVTGLYLLVIPLLALTVIGSGPGLLPPVPGMSLVLHLGVAVLALWMLALRHALDPGNWWTRIGATVAVLALVGVNQTGWLVSVSETRTWSASASPPQAAASSFPVAVDSFAFGRSGSGLSGTTGSPEGDAGAGGRSVEDAGALIEVRFVVRPGVEAPSGALALLSLVTLEETNGRILLTRRDPGLLMVSETSTSVNISIPARHLEGLRSGELVMVGHGQGLEAGWAPLELPLEVGARSSRGGNRVVVEEVSADELTLRWSAFTSRVQMRAQGLENAGFSGALGASFLEVGLLDAAGGSSRSLTRRRSSSSFGLGSSFDLVVSGPTRESHAISFVVPSPVTPAARLRIHILEPSRATSFRVEVPVDSWEGDQP